MRRVLIITYHFPPRPTVGSVRLGGLAKYLPRFGWEPVVVTPAFPGRSGWSVPLVETADRDVVAELKRRIGLKVDKGLQEQLGLNETPSPTISAAVSWATTLVKAIWCYPDDQRGWFPYALGAALDAVHRFGCSAILSSSSPVTVHLVAKAVKVRTSLPWVADLRDLWTDNHYYSFPWLRRVVERRLERRTLGMSDALVTVSEPSAEVLRRRYGVVPVHTILNGYDPEEVASSLQLSSDFTITYTGSLYDGKRDPSPLFKALVQLASQGRINRRKVRVNFYGPDTRKVLALARAHGIEDMVAAYPPVPREEALRLQRQSQILLLLNWNDPREKGVYTGKLFEYLAARRPLLAVGGPPGVVAELLDETRAGVHTCNSDAIAQVLAAWWDGYARCGAVPYQADPAKVERYSQVNMARQFAAVLSGLAL